MKYLFIDTSTNNLTISIATDKKILSTVRSDKINEHSKYALVKLKEAFALVGIKPLDIDKIIVVNGPGSFTGVRIGVTIAKTYAWSLQKEIIPVSSLLTNALGYDSYDYYVSVLDARRDYVYGAIYDSNYNEILPEQHISISKLYDVIDNLDGNVIVIGNINIDNYSANPIIIDVIKIINHVKDNESKNPHDVNPSYLKRVEAEEKWLGMLE